VWRISGRLPYACSIVASCEVLVPGRIGGTDVLLFAAAGAGTNDPVPLRSNGRAEGRAERERGQSRNGCDATVEGHGAPFWLVDRGCDRFGANDALGRSRSVEIR
jgi:hypothetical protein